ncbi:MAG: hypothetical protein ACRCXZ_09260 [Patescibacteria group bacterium]
MISNVRSLVFALPLALSLVCSPAIAQVKANSPQIDSQAPIEQTTDQKKQAQQNKNFDGALRILLFFGIPGSIIFAFLFWITSDKETTGSTGTGYSSGSSFNTSDFYNPGTMNQGMHQAMRNSRNAGK